jgi:glycosyltransferase involved in cell wall biosynthesis
VPRLSVVVPAYQVADWLAESLASVLDQSFRDLEVVVVDDGSTDGTREVLDEMEADPGYDRVRIFRQDRNYGKGAALRRGFAEATARFVVVQDADLEYDPAEYGVLVKPLLDDLADVVYGSRFHSSQPHRVLYFWHSVGNRFLTMLSNMFTNLNLTDMETCFKVFRREVIQSIPLEEDRFGFEPEVTAKIARGGWRVFELGISYHGRTYDEGKKIGWRDGVRAIWCILKYSSVGEQVRRLVDDRSAAGSSATLPSSGGSTESAGGSASADSSDSSAGSNGSGSTAGAGRGKGTAATRSSA